MFSPALIQSQLIAVLIAALDAVPVIPGGGAIAARVTNIAAGGIVTLAHAGGEFRVSVTASGASALTQGGAVLVSRGESGNGLQLVPVSGASRQGEAAQLKGAEAPVRGLAAAAAPPRANAETITRPVPAAAEATAAKPAIPPEAIRRAALRQDSLSPLFAALRAPAQAGAENLPRALQAAVAAFLDARLPESAAGEAPRIRGAIANSGVFLEAKLAAGAPPSGDAKAILLTLREAARAAAPDAPAQIRAAQARPPLEGLPPEPQPQTRTSTAVTAPAGEFAAQIRDGADAAIERIQLNQFASLPAGLERADGAPARHWSFEIPIALGPDTAVADFRIDRDGGGEAASSEARAWRVRFAMNLGNTGPVHAEIALRGKSISVGLWAESDATRESFSSASDELQSGLTEAAFETAMVSVRGGKPNAPASRAGRIVDRAS